MKRLLPILAALALVPFLSAAEKDKDKKPEAKAKPYPLDKCLVSDEKFEGSGMKPYELVVDGQTVKLCCKSCLKDFNKEKVSYMKKLGEEAGKKPKAK